MTKAEMPSPRVTPMVSLVLRHGLAVVSVAIALWLALLAQSEDINRLQFPPLQLAVAVTAWYAGGGPGALALVLASLAFNYFFIPPLYSPAIKLSDPLFVVFVFCGLMIASFGSRRRRIEQELREARDKLEVEVAERSQ